MKTKLLFLLLLSCVTTVSAQTYYYNNTKIFNENGYTYQCDVPASKMVTLYNKENRFTYIDMVNKTTGKVYSSAISHDPPTFQSHKQVRENSTPSSTEPSAQQRNSA